MRFYVGEFLSMCTLYSEHCTSHTAHAFVFISLVSTQFVQKNNNKKNSNNKYLCWVCLCLYIPLLYVVLFLYDSFRHTQMIRKRFSKSDSRRRRHLFCLFSRHPFIYLKPIQTEGAHSNKQKKNRKYFFLFYFQSIFKQNKRNYNHTFYVFDDDHRNNMFSMYMCCAVPYTIYI